MGKHQTNRHSLFAQVPFDGGMKMSVCICVVRVCVLRIKRSLQMKMDLLHADLFDV